MLKLPRELTAREFFLVVQEAMVEELRKSRLDIASRVKFTAEGEGITEARSLIAEIFAPPPPPEIRAAEQVALTVDTWAAAAQSGLMEVG